MTLFNKKYRIESTRLQHWNYANNGMYFVTICTENMINHFGNIINEKVILNKLGNFTKQCWKDIPNHFPFVNLDEYVIMPNHIHGIIVIDKPENKNVAIRHASVETLQDIDVKTGQNVNDLNNVETQNLASLLNKFGPQSKNLGSIVRGFKIGVTKYANKNNIPFKWQTRFHDHIIRDENELFNIQRYIIENPLKWELDKYYIN